MLLSSFDALKIMYLVYLFCFSLWNFNYFIYLNIRQYWLSLKVFYFVCSGRHRPRYSWGQHCGWQHQQCPGLERWGTGPILQHGDVGRHCGVPAHCDRCGPGASVLPTVSVEGIVEGCKIKLFYNFKIQNKSQKKIVVTNHFFLNQIETD